MKIPLTRMFCSIFPNVCPCISWTASSDICIVVGCDPYICDDAAALGDSFPLSDELPLAVVDFLPVVVTGATGACFLSQAIRCCSNVGPAGLTDTGRQAESSHGTASGVSFSCAFFICELDSGRRSNFFVYTALAAPGFGAIRFWRK